MRRSVIWLVGLTIFPGLVLLINCSGPLDTIEEPAPRSVDSVYLTDTLYSGDTVIYTDTVTITDTVVYTDTVMLTDTVIVNTTDTLMMPTAYCAQLSSSHREVVWLVQNLSGSFGLEFVAASSSDKPIQRLRVEIDGHEYVWEPSIDSKLIVEQDLDDGSVVRITTDSPHALGHAIDICLDLLGR